MPAVMITIETPTAMIPIVEHSRNKVKILLAVKKYSLVRPKIKINTKSKPTDISRRIDSCRIVVPPFIITGICLKSIASPNMT